VFSAIANGSRNLYLARTSGLNTVVLTQAQEQDLPDEDGRFSADGLWVIYKQLWYCEPGGVHCAKNAYARLLRMHIQLTDTGDPRHANKPVPLIRDKLFEFSQPVLAADGKTLYFTKNITDIYPDTRVHKIESASGEGIYRRILPDGPIKHFATAPSRERYYPILDSTGTVFFAGWTKALKSCDTSTDTCDPTQLYDQLFMQSPAAATATPLEVNDCSADNSDPTPIGNNLLIFSRDRFSPYRLYVGEITSSVSPKPPKLWALNIQMPVQDPSGIETSTEGFIGSSYTDEP
jgi:Tol biopolymer transport system component